MFYPNKIKSIKSHDRVLEVGPGATPHPRADVFLEIDVGEDILAAQRGYTQKIDLKKETVFYDGKRFPFEDNSFDYVIASHVIEHVQDVGLFVEELCRVSQRGYIEFPTILYEYLYNFDVHLNFIKLTDGNRIAFRKKNDTNLSAFKPVQDAFLTTLTNGYSSLVDDLQEYMFEGFEWSGKLTAVSAENIEELIPDLSSLEKYHQHYVGNDNVTSGKLKKVFRRFKRKIKLEIEKR